MRTRFVGVAAVGFAVVFAGAGNPVAEPAASEDTVVYQLALLVEGSERQSVGETQAARIQEQHLAFLSGLMKDGKALLAGPVQGGRKVWGAVLFDLSRPEAAEEILSADPWIENGRLVAEVHPLRTTKGWIEKPDEYEDSLPAGLALLIAAPMQPRFSDAYLVEVEEEHRAFMKELVAEGDAALHGTFEEGGTLREALVFYTDNAAEVRDLTEDDPAIDEGLLRLELMRWYLPGNSLPVIEDDEEGEGEETEADERPAATPEAKPAPPSPR